MELPAHPYYPLDIEIINYVPNEWDTLTLISMFSTGITLLLSTTCLMAMGSRPQISRTDLITVMWFVLCGCIHIFFEGYFVYNFRNMGSRQDLFGQLWKEYSLSDSRYQTQNGFVLCVETITVTCFGPLSLVTAYMITKNHALRYILQALISMGHLYSDVLYYATSLYDQYFLDISHSRPEALYFWGYFVFMNAFWIVIPAILLHDSMFNIARMFETVKRLQRVMKDHFKDD